MTRNAIIFALCLTLGVSKVNAQAKDSIVEVTLNHSPRQFICNNQLCNGKQVGYYRNGVIKIDGCFKKGKAQGKVNDYDSTGKLETTRFFKKGYIKRSLSFDSLQRLTRDLDFGKRKTTTYYYDNTSQPIKKEILIWQGADWSKGTIVTYERKNDKWVETTISS